MEEPEKQLSRYLGEGMFRCLIIACFLVAWVIKQIPGVRKII
jgi:hypothetical protein